MAQGGADKAAANPSLGVLIAVTALTPFCLQSVLPALPAIGAEFNTGGGGTLVLTVFLLAMAVGQLSYGALSDRFGRKPPLVVGMAGAAIFSLLCVFAPSFWSLLALRVMQGLMASSGLVLARAMVRDAHPLDRSAQVIAVMVTVMSTVPAVAPIIGGQLELYLGWRYIFLADAVFALVLVVLALGLPETNRQKVAATGIGALASDMLAVLRLRQFLAYATGFASHAALFFTVLAAAPFLLAGPLGMRPDQAALYLASVPASYMVGNIVATRLIPRFGVRWVAVAGTWGAAACALLMVAWMALYGLSAAAIFVPMNLGSALQGLAVAATLSLAVSAEPRLIGAASGLAGFVQMTFGALATILVGLLERGDGMPSALIIAGCGLLGVVAVVWGGRKLA